jgi:pimeloyl-ACP methyl ester carboxylesterase
MLSPSVVLLHSSASSSRQWESLRELLEARFRVHAIDLHGHGTRASWTGAQPLSLSDEAELCIPLLDESGPVHVVGHSYGGAVALKLAARYPGRVRSVVAYEPVLFRWLLSADGGHGEASDIAAIAASMREELVVHRPDRAAQRFVDFWSGANAWDSLSMPRKQAIEARVPDVLRNFDALFADPLGPRELDRASPPLLILTGTRTVAVTRHLGMLMRAELPRATHEFMPGMGHMGPLTHAAEFNRRVAAFLHHQTGAAAGSVDAVALASARSAATQRLQERAALDQA